MFETKISIKKFVASTIELSKIKLAYISQLEVLNKYLSGADPGFSNAGGAKDYVDAAHIPRHEAQSPLASHTYTVMWSVNGPLTTLPVL